MATPVQLNLSINDQSDLEGLLALHGSAQGFRKFGKNSQLIDSLLKDLEGVIKPILGEEGWNLHMAELDKQFNSLAQGNSIGMNQETKQPEFKMNFGK